MKLEFNFKYQRFQNFLRAFKSRYTPWHDSNSFYETTRFSGEPISYKKIIFHPTSMGVCPNYEVNTDRNFLITRHEDVLRFHYFSLKAYFIENCKDPFLKAYYKKLQNEKNDKYYGYVKFYFSKDEIFRRHQDRLARDDLFLRDDDLPF